MAGIDSNFFNFSNESKLGDYNSFFLPEAGGVSPMPTNQNSSFQNFSKNILFESRLSGGQDYYRTWNGVASSIQLGGRNGITAGSNFSVSSADMNLGSITIIADNSLATSRVALWTAESKNYIKLSNSSKAYFFQRAVFKTSLVGDNTNSIGFFAYDNVSNNIIDQADWNIDTFGSSLLNPSGITIDFEETQTFVMELNNNGIGILRFGFLIGNAIYYAHDIPRNNDSFLNSFGTLNKPVRIDLARSSDAVELWVGMFNFQYGAGLVSQVDTTPSGGQAARFNLYDTSVYEEGGSTNTIMIPFGSGTGAAYRNIATETPVASIQIKPIFPVATNRTVFGFENITVDAKQSDLQQGIDIKIVYNGTLTGEAFSSFSPLSGLEVDIAATGITGGTVIHSSTVYPNGESTVVLDGDKIFRNFQNNFSLSNIQSPIGNGSATWNVTQNSTISVVLTPKDASAQVGVNFNTVEKM